MSEDIEKPKTPSQNAEQVQEKEAQKSESQKEQQPAEPVEKTKSEVKVDDYNVPASNNPELTDTQKFNLQQEPLFEEPRFRFQPTQYRYVPMHKAPWNNRFYIASKMNSTSAHNFYKEYFDKPERIKQRILVPTEKLDIPIEDFYRQTAKAQRLFGSPNSKKLKVVTRPQPLAGNKSSVSRPGTSQKTFRSTGKSTRLVVRQFESVPSLKTLTIKEHNWNQEFNSRDWSRPAPFTSNLKQTQLRASQEEGDRNGLQTAASKKRPGTQGSMAPSIGRSSSQKNFRITANRGQNSLARTLKASRSQKAFEEEGWNNRIGLPISTYNEKVFKHYRLMFDHL